VSRVRVAFLVERFPATSETFIATQLRGLQLAGHTVDVVSQHRPWPGEPVHGEMADSGLLEKTHYVDVPLAADSLETVLSLPLAPGRHDVIHAHFGPNARRFLFARDQTDTPLVVTFHGYDYSAQPRAHGAAMYDALFEVADVVTYNCEHAREALETLGCPPWKLRRLRMPIVVSEFAFRARRLQPGEPLRILTVGRLVDKKGHAVAIRAVADVARERPVGYDIVGGGPLAEPLAALVRELELEDVVSLHGARDSTFVRALLDRAHLFVLASAEAPDGDREGTPLVLMEAQACGLPVVSTLHAGIPEVVLDGRTGVLVPEHDSGALTEAILELARQHDSWPALGRRGRTHVEQTFDVDPCVEELLDVYACAAAARDDGRNDFAGTNARAANPRRG
jgi:colanic acid/amylovoran biosynthesis glycosyltransferase